MTKQEAALMILDKLDEIKRIWNETAPEDEYLEMTMIRTSNKAWSTRVRNSLLLPDERQIDCHRITTDKTRLTFSGAEILTHEDMTEEGWRIA